MSEQLTLHSVVINDNETAESQTSDSRSLADALTPHKIYTLLPLYHKHFH